MANFDTASKRFSGMQLGEVPEATLPVPDGTFSQGDRQHLLTLYSGIAASSPSGAFFGSPLMVIQAGQGNL